MSELDLKNPASGNPPENRTGTGFLNSLGLFAWDFGKVFLIALAIIIPVRFYLFQPFIVTGSSMQPNFYQGEYLIIDELTYHFSAPQRGDVVVIVSPADDKQYFIKRVVGLPGETVIISGGKVEIKNSEHPLGKTLDEKYLPNNVATFGNITVTLPPDEFYVLGDNRIASSDSRFFGPIKRSTVVGRVLLRAFPLDRFSTFATPQYATN